MVRSEMDLIRWLSWRLRLLNACDIVSTFAFNC